MYFKACLRVFVANPTKSGNLKHCYLKTRTLKKDKVNIITLDCSKNMVDSEVLSGQLANDINVVHEKPNATITS